MKIKSMHSTLSVRSLSRSLSRFLLTLGIVFLSLALTSCILGSANRDPSDDSDVTSDGDGNSSNDNATNTEDASTEAFEEPPTGGDDAFDTVLEETTLYSFEFDIQLNGDLSFDDLVIAKSVSLSQPRLDDFDDDDRYGNQFNSNSMASQEWDNRDRRWVDNSTVPFNGVGVARNYYRLDTSASADDSDAWQEIADNNARSLSVIDGDIYEDHLGVKYFWYFKSPKNLNNEGLDSHLKQLVFRDIFLDSSTSTGDTEDGSSEDDAELTREEELLNWIGEVDNGDEDFPSGSEKYVVIKYIQETTYVIDQSGYFAGGEIKYRFEDVASGASDLISLAQAIGSGVYFNDYDLTINIAASSTDLDDEPTDSISINITKDGISASGTISLVTVGDGSHEIWLIDIPDQDKFELQIPYDVDIFLAQPEDDGSIYFGKRYNATDQNYVESTQETPEGIEFKLCLVDFRDVDKREGMTDTGRAFKLYSCPKQHIFFNQQAIDAIKDHLQSWRDEEYEDDN